VPAQSSLLQDIVALGSLAAMSVGTVGTTRRGHWPSRILLIAGALVWPVPDHPLQGPVVLKLSYLHGIHVADLLSLVAIALALTLPGHRDEHPTVTTAATALNADHRPAR
jgi:hypothetical protein